MSERGNIEETTAQQSPLSVILFYWTPAVEAELVVASDNNLAGQ